MRAMIERQIVHLTRLVDDMIDGSRVTAGKIKLKLSRTDLRDFVERGVELRKPAIEAASQELVIELPETPVYSNADATRMTQVIGNLLGNATKFTPLAGRIVIKLEVENGCAVQLPVRF